MLFFLILSRFWDPPPPFRRMLSACTRALIVEKNQMVDVTLPCKSALHVESHVYPQITQCALVFQPVDFTAY